MFDILKGLQHLHARNIIHRDLKLKNVLVQNKEHSTKYKLCDFGFSDFKDAVDNSPETGTPGYLAPEI